MKVLILAYACSPERGSEPKVGWDSVVAIAKNHHCWVVTSAKFKKEIESQLAVEPLANVHFIYHGPDFKWIGNGLLARVQTWLLYKRWQASVVSVAKRLHEDIEFDVVHHVTLTAWRMPPRVWRLSVPFVWGPVGGTAEVPKQFFSQLSLTARSFELARKFHTTLNIHASGFKKCLRETSALLGANEETKAFFVRQGLSAPVLILPAVYFSSTRVHELKRPSIDKGTGPLRLFAGGTLQGSKGISLAIRALARVRESGLDFHYTIAGHGPEIGALRELIRNLGLSQQVELVPPFTGGAYVAQLHASDVYLMPSFRETTPVTLLEAMLAGCYPVVADISAPGEIVRELGGDAISCESVQDLVCNLAKAVSRICRNRKETNEQASLIAEHVARKYQIETYADVVDKAYKIALAQYPTRACKIK
jgi:glycosyltransferase involved in cell wall biosynthesis